MTINATTLETAVASLQVESFGQTAVLFEPTAARCSSSSSTCCILCVKK